MVANICFVGSQGGGEVERMREYALEMVEDSQVALLYIQASRQALQQVVYRIRGNVRRNDVVLLQETNCIILLPATPVEGAQAVARRIYTLLADVEFEMQIMYDKAAFALVRRLQNEHPFSIINEGETSWRPGTVLPYSRDQSCLPYLAFLASYPAPRILRLFPYELANRHRCVPVGAERGVLTLAASRPLDQDLIAHFYTVTQHNIFQVRCEEEMVADILEYWKSAVCYRSKGPGQHV